MVHRSLPLMAATVAALCLAACTSVPSVDQLGQACAGLVGRSIPASSIGLPSKPATVTSAVLVAAVPEAVNDNSVTPATPAYCKLLGTVAPSDPQAQSIHFQLNLPTQWNGKALQYGGGGFNGTLVTGLAPLRDAAPGDALPITRGYATFGTDSGHQASASPASEPATFALNDEMLENFAFASYKKVRDVAVGLMRAFYGQSPRQLYYFGGSEGGREGLTMAQRFPADYDGIVSVVPVINWTGLFHAFVRNSVPQFTEWMNASKAPLVAKAVVDACDGLDGLVDGVINHYLGCQARVNLQTLRCTDGIDAGPQCLSDAELALMQRIHSPYTFSFPLANGLAHYPSWLYGHEDSLDGPQAMSLVRWVTGLAAPTAPPNAATASTQWLYGSNWIRYAVTRDATFDVTSYRPEAFAARVQKTSALMDSTDQDLSAFFAQGGKLIIRENAGDRAQSAWMGIEYYQAMVARFGQAAVDQSVRLYVSPSSTHTGNARTVTDKRAIPTMVDLLDPLDRWVTAGNAPADVLTQTSKASLPPFQVQSSRPMCRYPGYPHYTGGDRLQAGGYACRSALP
jgi:hypothetical protein